MTPLTGEIVCRRLEKKLIVKLLLLHYLTKTSPSSSSSSSSSPSLLLFTCVINGLIFGLYFNIFLLLQIFRHLSSPLCTIAVSNHALWQLREEEEEGKKDLSIKNQSQSTCVVHIYFFSFTVFRFKCLYIYENENEQYGWESTCIALYKQIENVWYFVFCYIIFKDTQSRPMFWYIANWQ